MTEKEKSGSGGKTRREFLKDAGLLVGGTAIGSTVLLAACGGDGETTVTKTVTNTSTVTQGGSTVTLPGSTVTTTVGGGATVTATETATKFVDPIDGMEFDTLADLKAHFDSAHGATGAMPGVVTLNVNGMDHLLQLKPYWSLAFVLREKLGLPGTKVGCDRGECGSCTVIADGRSVYACTMLAIEAEGMSIVTVEGLSDGINLSPVQQAFYERSAGQCGFCTPGFLMAATALLGKNSSPTRDEVREALSGRICPCGETHNYIDAVLDV